MDDVLYILASAIATLVSVVAPTTVYILRRVRSLEAENTARYKEDHAAKNAKIAELERRLADMEVQAGKVPALERQVDTLCKQLEALQMQLDETETRYDLEHNVNLQLQARIVAVTQERDTALTNIDRLTIERDAYRAVLVEGAALAQKESTDKSTSKSDESAPVAQEKKEEETNQ